MKYSKITSIKKVGKRKTWDIEMPEPNNFVADKFVVHNSGQTMLYVNRHLGKNEITYEHELLENLTKDTKGIILYQEQIMQIFNQVGGMSWATAEMARKVITKSKGKKVFEEMRKEFVTNANKLHNMEIKEAEKLYDVVSTFGSYGFNKTHAVEYSIISYWCAWLKTYYPLEFYKSILKYENDEAQIRNYLQDAQLNGVTIEYPNINFSKFGHSIEGGKIYSGLSSIKGIGQKTAEKIIKNQPYENYDDFLKRCKIGKSIIKLLAVADCFRDFKINVKSIYEDKECLEDYEDHELVELIMKHTTLKPKMDITKIFDFGNYDFIDINTLNQDEHSNKLGLIRGIVTEIVNKDKLIRPNDKEHMHAFEPHMIYLNINDGTGNIAAQMTPHIYDKYKNVIYDWDKKPIIIYGQFNETANKIFVQLAQTPGKTGDIDKFQKNYKECSTCIISAVPAVSKNKKSYYKIKLKNGDEGLCFKPPCRLYAGNKIIYQITNPPFMNIRKAIQ